MRKLCFFSNPTHGPILKFSICISDSRYYCWKYLGQCSILTSPQIGPITFSWLIEARTRVKEAPKIILEERLLISTLPGDVGKKLMFSHIVVGVLQTLISNDQDSNAMFSIEELKNWSIEELGERKYARTLKWFLDDNLLWSFLRPSPILSTSVGKYLADFVKPDPNL